LISFCRLFTIQRREFIMSLNRLFETIEKAGETARWQSAFGEPQTVGDRTIIPVARVGYGFGLGFGHGTGVPEGETEPVSEGEGGGGGGGASSKPLGVIVVTPEHVYFEETEDASKLGLVAIGVAGFSIVQFFRTLRAIFGRE
jgi:uncharacterized spore protein YtfJ